MGFRFGPPKPHANRPDPLPAAQPPPKPLSPLAAPAGWEVKEPDDPHDPVPHLLCAEGASMGRRVIGASVRGRLHAHTGSYREDHFAFAAEAQRHILVVSDGAGSSACARVASRLACDTILAELTALPQIDIDALVDATMAARAAVLAEAERRFLQAKDAHCTLMVAVLADDHLTCLQVGDGVLGFVHDGVVTLPLTADEGEYSAETVFLTSSSMDRVGFLTRATRVPLPPEALVLLATDGLSDDLYPYEKGLLRLLYDTALDGFDRPGLFTQPLDADSMTSWLQYQKKGSSDDRTLLISGCASRES